MRFEREKKLLLLFVLLTPLIFSAWNCANDGDDFTASFFANGNVLTSRVDLAVGDRDVVTPPANSKVLLYLDVLSTAQVGATIAPDVILNNAKSRVVNPVSIVFSDKDLYIANLADGGSAENISIFRNYMKLANNASPTFRLTTGTAGIDTPNQILVSKEADTLIDADFGDNEIALFANISMAAAEYAPTVTLDNATSLVNGPTGIAILGDGSTGNQADLFVANHANTAGSSASVTVYRDIATLATNQAPDARLNADTSFQGTGCAPNKVHVEDNTLYVSTDTAACGVFIFNNASTLATNALPDVVLTAISGFYFSPQNMDVVDNNLWVADAGDPISCSNKPGAFAFSPADGLTTGDTPEIALNATQGANFAIGSGGALFVNAMDNCSTGTGNVDIYIPSALVLTDSLPFVTLTGASTVPATELVNPVSLATLLRDEGT